MWLLLWDLPTNLVGSAEGTPGTLLVVLTFLALVENCFRAAYVACSTSLFAGIRTGHLRHGVVVYDNRSSDCVTLVYGVATNKPGTAILVY
jgi:hypothetical protein